MSKELNFKPYLIVVAIICVIICIFSYKVAFGLILGTAYFFINDIINQNKYPKFNSKSGAFIKVILLSFVQFILILGIALLCFYTGGLYSLLISFAGITIPHIYFIIVELKKIRK